MGRELICVDDIVSGIVACLENLPPDDRAAKAAGSVSPHRLHNVGNSHSENLSEIFALIEQACVRETARELLPTQSGDVCNTFADISAIKRDLGFAPTTTIAEGVPHLVDWYRAYQSI